MISLAVQELQSQEFMLIAIQSVTLPIVSHVVLDPGPDLFGVLLGRRLTLGPHLEVAFSYSGSDMGRAKC